MSAHECLFDACGRHAGTGGPPVWFLIGLAVLGVFLVAFILLLLDGS